MPSILEFPKRALRARGTRPRRLPADAAPDIAELASRLTGLQSKAKGDIRNAIFMLDLAAQHARQSAKGLCDPTMKQAFDQHISTIEQLLQLARNLALKL